jgi:hypothetical protein
MPSPASTSVLVVTDQIAVSADMVEAIRARASVGPIQVRVLVPNPAPAEWHPTHPERHAKVQAAQRVLEQTLPALQNRNGHGLPSAVSRAPA